MNISEMESKPDWALIVTSVQCPTCYSEPGELCRVVGGPNIMLRLGIIRSDWHAERKYAAAKAWREASESPVKEDDGTT